MPPLPRFLAALDLDTEADERAVRRAYAKRLKLIDQEAEPKAFQALRETYEQALAWAVARARRARDQADVQARAATERAAELEALTIRPATPQAAPSASPDDGDPDGHAPAEPPAPAPEPLPSPVRNATHAAATVGTPLAALDVPLPTPETKPGAPIGAPLPGPRMAPWSAPAPTLASHASPTLAPVPRPAPAPAAPDLQAGPPLMPRPTPPPVPTDEAGSRHGTPLPRPTAMPGAAPAAKKAPSVGAPLAPSRPVASPTAQEASPRILGDAVFEVFTTLVARGLKDDNAATLTLRIALDDPRLINLDARGWFEARVAGLFADGWRPGHDLLFKCACAQFGWEADRRRLQAFGDLGAMIDAAVREQLIFQTQDSARILMESLLIRRLRTEAPRNRADLMAEMPLLKELLQRYPNWLRIVTARDVVTTWIRQWEALPPEVQEPPKAPPPPAANKAAAPRVPANLRAAKWQGPNAVRARTPKRELSLSGKLVIGFAALVGLSNLIGSIARSDRGPTPEPRQEVLAPAALELARSGRSLDDRQREAQASLERALAASKTPDQR